MSPSPYPKVSFLDITRYFWKGARFYRGSLIFLILTVVVVNIVGTIIPVFYKQFFDTITGAINPQSIASKLVQIIIIIAFLHGVLWILYRAFSFVNSNFQAKVMARLRQQSYDYLLGHSYGFFTSHFSGALVQKVNRFARSFERLSDRIIWDMLSLAVKVFSIMVVVFFMNRWVALVIFIWALIFILFNILFSMWKIRYDIKVAEIDSRTTGYLADTLTNQNTISLFGGTIYESAGFRKVTNDQASITLFNWNLTNYIEAGQSLLGFSIEFLLFYFAIRYWQDGLVTVGFFVLLQAYLISLLDQLWGFTRIIRDIYQAYADAKEMVELLLLPHEITDAPDAHVLEVRNGNITFDHASFQFHKSRMVLQDITTTIRAGEKVALIGPSGAGKTTFVRLILRLYGLTSGKILIDGHDIAKVTQESLRKYVSLVPQDPILFHRTLAENIAYGKRDATRAEIEHAAQLAHCDEFIAQLPLGLDTYVGERGVKLSGGERQRIAIARAILKNAPILILDEATSSLDSHSEILIQDALEKLMKGKTVIVIAHRLSTIQKMDRIIVVDQGQIIEEGSHRSLLRKKKSLYRKLWKIQAGGFLKETMNAETADQEIVNEENILKDLSDLATEEDEA